ncbi:hypothetical protein AOQ84DRAFT_439760 [Glonium stellatum]|uniref:Uncharacterized protein n=1 Tax=Glonium stellatum TaxID=574774 RepID=A0A8E2JT30_9PEZI|nr:hypothetical protein AOQ84DRAFT_439760 [Glonium stellatum]
MTVMATLATMAIESSKESPGVPTLATPEDYRLSARQASPTISTAAAATVDGLVNLDSMPSCAFKSCVVSSHPALPCPTVSTSCSASASATAASDGCAGVGIPTTCYCALPNPLFCAWGCRWFDWMLAENWFNATCPQVPPIDFTPVPACARACFEESIFNYGCLTYQKNCFCSVGSLFGCNAGCTPQENQTIASWYASACVVPTASALQVAAVQTTGSSIIPSSHPWGGFSWYEIFSIVVGGLSVVAFLIYVSVWKDIINRRDLSRLEKARTQQRKKIKG